MTGNVDMPTGAPVVAGGPDDNPAADQAGPHINVGAVAGGVGASLVLLILGALIYFCLKKRGTLGRRRSDMYDSRSDTSSTNGLVRRASKIRAILDPRKILSRSSSRNGRPEMSTLPSDRFRPPPSPGRSRSSSAPASTFRGRFNGMMNRRHFGDQDVIAEAMPTRPVATHAPVLPGLRRSSVSSLARGVYNTEQLNDDNNPFRDPDPNAPLRLINPDSSRNGTPATTPQATGRTTFFPGGGIASPREFRRADSQAQNPFLDASDPNPLNSSPLSPATLANVQALRKSYGSRPKSVSSLYSLKEGSHGSPRSIASMDSGFVSAVSSSEEESLERTRSQSQSRIPSQRSSIPSNQSHSTIRLSQFLPRLSGRASGGPLGNMGFDFGDFGEPGPTRPTTQAFTPNINRVSDPFDLDKLELLGWTTRAGTPVSQKSGFTLGGTRKSGHQKRKSTQLQGWTGGWNTPS